MRTSHTGQLTFWTFLDLMTSWSILSRCLNRSFNRNNVNTINTKSFQATHTAPDGQLISLECYYYQYHNPIDTSFVFIFVTVHWNWSNLMPFAQYRFLVLICDRGQHSISSRLGDFTVKNVARHARLHSKKHIDRESKFLHLASRQISMVFIFSLRPCSLAP